MDSSYFDFPLERRGTNSYKWDDDAGPDMLPMWVADMDFRTAPVIIEALRRRVEHGAFGYTKVPEEYYAAVIDWFAQRHGLNVERGSIIYTSGVVPAVSAVIKALTVPGDKVIVQTPVYNCFFSSIRNNGCEVLANPLRLHMGKYVPDFDDLRAKASDPRAKALLLCNPHNPGGRVWTPDELRTIGEICRNAGVTVISDEIHCELVFPPYRYTPYASLGPEFARTSVTCSSPSKAFNTAGLQIANIFAEDPAMRAAIDRAININEVCDVNPFGVVALIAAYREGLPWLNSLVAYLHDNYTAACRFFASELPKVKIMPLEATYLLWADCSAYGVPSEKLEEILRANSHVWVNGGTHYGPEGEGYIRINLACPRATLEEGLRRIKKGLDNLI